MENILTILYLIIGFVYIIYDYYSYVKSYIKTNEFDSSLLCVYWITCWILWPICLLKKIFQYGKEKFNHNDK